MGKPASRLFVFYGHLSHGYLSDGVVYLQSGNAAKQAEGFLVYVSLYRWGIQETKDGFFCTILR